MFYKILYSVNTLRYWISFNKKHYIICWNNFLQQATSFEQLHASNAVCNPLSWYVSYNSLNAVVTIVIL